MRKIYRKMTGGLCQFITFCETWRHPRHHPGRLFARISLRLSGDPVGLSRGLNSVRGGARVRPDDRVQPGAPARAKIVVDPGGTARQGS
jgi:hypothetical protein